jgi:hypothetical protein
MSEPSEKSLNRMKIYTEKYWEKTGTSPHPIQDVTTTKLPNSSAAANGSVHVMK